MLRRPLGLLFPAIFAVYLPTCTSAVQPTMPPWDAHMAELFQMPADVSERDTLHGQWGEEYAPDAHATYRFVSAKRHGVNPGLTVSDPQGREWHVKQAPQPAPKGAEGPAEVVLSRVLSAIGYHQPPVYFVRSFAVEDATGTHVERGGIVVAAGLPLPRHIGWRELIVIALAASPSLGFGLFFAAAVFPDGPLLVETKMGAILTAAGVLLALAAARLLRVGRFAGLAAPRQAVGAHVTKERA